jgi:hypothetical protein
MKERISILLFGIGLGFSFSLSAASQIVGSAHERCEEEKVHPNLFMQEAASLSGTLVDQSGASFSRIMLQLRTADGAKILQFAPVDDRGRFEFASVPAGEFRIVPVRIVEGKEKKVTGFNPPQPLHCHAGARCELRVVLPVRPTDLMYTFCPPK